MPTIKPSKLSGLKANALIGMVSQHMKSYRINIDKLLKISLDTRVLYHIIHYLCNVLANAVLPMKKRR